MQHSSERNSEGGAHRPGPRRRWFRRFARDTGGATAVEFAFVALPFFLILFSMFEVGMTFTANTLLQNAVYEAGRQIRTGQIQMSGQSDKAKLLRDALCSNLTGIMSCNNDNLRIEVRAFSSSADAKCNPPIKADGSFKPSYTFQPGEPGDFVLVCAFYRWETYTPGLGLAMKSVGPGGFIMESSVAVRNEPYKGAI